MQETNIFEYYAFGFNYYILRYKSEGSPVHGSEHTLISRIDEFLEYLDDLDLKVTKKAAYELISLREEAEKMPKDAKVDAELARKVTNVVNKIDATLDAELKMRSAFIVTPKRYPLEHILKDPTALFASNVFKSLPNICQFDFQQAGKCIAFGLPTAAAFHLMRGVEGVLSYYYCCLVKHGRVKVLMWSDMVEHLRKRRNASPKALLDSLDNIRINSRNPTQHPQARYDMDEAQDLFSISIEVVNRMIKDLSSRKIIKLDE